LNMQGGSLTVDVLSATGGSNSVINFSGGTLSSGSSSVNTGSVFTVGDGSGATATYHMDGGTHTFANGVSLNTDGALTGSGTLVGEVGGAGSIDPGNSPGIATVSSVDTTGGIDFNLEFTAKNAEPVWSSASASGNDVLRITGADSFTAALDSDNIINVFLDVSSVSSGDTFTGGFFTLDDITSDLENASFEYYVLGDGSGISITYSATGYYALSEYDSDLLLGYSVIAQDADFGSGTVSGYTVLFTASTATIPEPSTFGLICGLVGVCSISLRRRVRV